MYTLIYFHCLLSYLFFVFPHVYLFLRKTNMRISRNEQYCSRNFQQVILHVNSQEHIDEVTCETQRYLLIEYFVILQM